MKKKSKEKPDWEKFHAWEKKLETARLKKLTPTEKIRILEDLYQTALKIKKIRPGNQ